MTFEHRARGDLGEGGASLLRRIMGILLAAFSVNLVLNAFQKWLSLPPI